MLLYINTTGCDGSDHFWCWLLWMLGAFLLGALLGWLLKNLFGSNDNSGDYDSLKAELDACRKSKNSLANVGTAGAASFAGSGNKVAATPVAAVAFDAAGAKLAFGKKIKDNDLTIVEGIGPKIQELFHNHSVNTWRGLSECSLDKCKSVLESGGKRFQMHNPATWPKQAEMAANGKWAALKKWQDELDGGK